MINEYVSKELIDEVEKFKSEIKTMGEIVTFLVDYITEITECEEVSDFYLLPEN